MRERGDFYLDTSVVQDDHVEFRCPPSICETGDIVPPLYRWCATDEEPPPEPTVIVERPS